MNKDISINNQKKVFLTFDDGPGKNTPLILDVLNKYNIKATFFNLGIMEEKFPDLVKEVVSQGHTLANHTWSHNPSLYNDSRRFINEIKKVSDFQEKLTGKKAKKIFRFPFGSDKATKECINELNSAGYNYVDWNVYLQDGSRNPSPEKAYNLAINGVLNCSETPVILTHMERAEKTGPIKVFEPIIKKLLNEGYIFKTINENDHLVHLSN